MKPIVYIHPEIGSSANAARGRMLFEDFRRHRRKLIRMLVVDDVETDQVVEEHEHLSTAVSVEHLRLMRQDPNARIGVYTYSTPRGGAASSLGARSRVLGQGRGVPDGWDDRPPPIPKQQMEGWSGKPAGA